MALSRQDFSTGIVRSHNEVLYNCGLTVRLLDDGRTYRPNIPLVASRQAHLTESMHYRRHQPLY